MGRALIPYDWCRYKKRRRGHRHTQRADHVRTQGGEGCVHAKERGLRGNQPCSERINACCLSSPACDMLWLPEQTNAGVFSGPPWDSLPCGLTCAVPIPAGLPVAMWKAGQGGLPVFSHARLGVPPLPGVPLWQRPVGDSVQRPVSTAQISGFCCGPVFNGSSLALTPLPFGAHELTRVCGAWGLCHSERSSL